MEKVVNIKHKNDKDSDLDYWLSKSPEERLQAVEILREQYIKTLPEDERRFKRVLKIVEREKS
ncbi:MAG: hypothetical protein V1779_12325 [bacterium]